MTGTLLAYFPSPPQGVWHLGPLPIRAYALFIIAGIVAALLIGDRRWEARGGERGLIYDIALWVVPFGLIGGRLYHLATDWRTYWGPGGAGSVAALRMWDGGLGIWGAVALGVVGAWIGCRRRGVPLPAFLDAVAPGLVLAQAIGRLGNYFNQELYGRETTLPWGLEIFYRRDPSGYIDPHSLEGVSTGQVALVVQPTFLYELIWNVLVFVALIYLDRRFTFGHGRLFAVYVAGYCVGRFVVELLRDDTATHIAGIRINSFTSTFVFIGAVVYLILAPKGREDPAALRGTEHAAEEPEELEPAAELATVASASASASAVTAAAPAAAGDDGKPADSAETTASAEANEPETQQAEVAEPETAEAEVAEPEAVEAAEAEVAEPAAAEAEAAEPEVAEVEVEEPEMAQPHVEGRSKRLRWPWQRSNRLGVTEAEGVAEAQAAEPEPEESEVAEAEAEEPEVEAPAIVEAEVEEPEVAGPDAVETEPEEPAAETEEPQPEVPEEPEVAEAEVEESEPEVAEPVAEEAPEDEKPAETPEPPPRREFRL